MLFRSTGEITAETLGQGWPTSCKTTGAARGAWWCQNLVRSHHVAVHPCRRSPGDDSEGNRTNRSWPLTGYKGTSQRLTNNWRSCLPGSLTPSPEQNSDAAEFAVLPALSPKLRNPSCSSTSAHPKAKVHWPSKPASRPCIGRLPFSQ